MVLKLGVALFIAKSASALITSVQFKAYGSSKVVASLEDSMGRSPTEGSKQLRVLAIITNETARHNKVIVGVFLNSVLEVWAINYGQYLNLGTFVDPRCKERTLVGSTGISSLTFY